MEIHYKSITHERTEDAPFVSALVCASECSRGCTDCFNQHIKSQPTLIAEAEKIIEEITSNPFNEGICLSGLEWSETPLELIELVTQASKAALKIIIYTGCEKDLFFERIGKACVDATGEADTINRYMGNSVDNTIYTFIGSMMLDTVIKCEYYLKCGRYSPNLKREDNIMFGVKLASSNQQIYKIITNTEEE